MQKFCTIEESFRDESIISLYIHNLELDIPVSREMSKYFLFNRELQSSLKVADRLI